MTGPDPDTIAVLRAITRVAFAAPHFDAEDVRRHLAARGEVVHPNAMGAGFHLARKTGLIEEIGTGQSTHAGGRRHRIGVYRLVGKTTTLPAPAQEPLVR